MSITADCVNTGRMGTLQYLLEQLRDDAWVRFYSLCEDGAERGPLRAQMELWLALDSQVRAITTVRQRVFMASGAYTPVLMKVWRKGETKDG